MASRPPRSQASVRQKRNRKKRNWVRLITSFLMLVLIGELVYMSLTHPRLRVARVDIHGARTIPVSDLRDRATCAMGVNIILADTKAVRQNVLRNPVVLRAKVSRRPLNKLIIRVEERQPYAVLASSGRLYVCDESGFVFRQLRQVAKGVPVLELQGPSPIGVGSKPSARLISSSFDCLQRSLKNNFSISRISVDPNHNICLNMESGLSVRLGQPTDLDGKFKVLKKVLARRPDIATEGVYVDVTCVTAPSWKAKSDSPAL